MRRFDASQARRWPLRAIIRLTLSFCFAAPAFAAAAIAKMPKSLRQIYRDGSYTELQCDRAGDGFACEFRLAEGRKRQTYSFRLALQRMVYLSSYAFWDYGKAGFTLAMDVSCDERELALLPKGAELDASCRLWFSPQDAQLLPQRVDVTAYFDGRDLKQTLDLGVQGEKGPLPERLVIPSWP